MSAPHDTSLVGDAELSFAAWANFDSLLPDPGPLNRMTLLAKEGEWRLSQEADPKLECRIGDRIASADLGGLVVPGSWVHFACTWDQVTIRAYINGVEVDARVPNSVNQAFIMAPLTVGKSAVSGTLDHLEGTIDHARVFRRTLTQAEVCALAGDACP